tara:strand:+ start:1008 stop:1703 length:696 start_codon:yes stop_codon:yes gene_type:complete
MIKENKAKDITKNDLPFDYKTHLAHRKETDTLWHYDPSVSDAADNKVKKIFIPKTLYSAIEDFAENIPKEYVGTIFESDNIDNYMNDVVIWKKLDHVYHGYRKANTEVSYIRMSYEDSPDFLQEIMEQVDLDDPCIGVIKLPPGNIIPWHYDSLVHFKKERKNSNVEIRRSLVFPFQWDWGHIFQIGNNVLSNWKGGESYLIPKYRYHLTVNAGIKDFYMLAVTGELKSKF